MGNTFSWLDGERGPPGPTGPAGSNGQAGSNGLQGIQGRSYDSATLRVVSGTSVIVNSETVQLKGSGSIISLEEYNTGISNIYFQVKMPLLTNSGNRVKIGLKSSVNYFHFEILYGTPASSRYTIVGSSLPATTYTTDTIFSIYIANNTIYYIVNGTPIYNQSINQETFKLNIDLSVTSPLNINNIQFYKIAKVPTPVTVLSTEEFMYQAQAPLMGLLASVGVNSTSYTDYFEEPVTAPTRSILENDVLKWQEANKPLTSDKISKFVNFYVCWIKDATNLISVNLPYSCYSKEATTVREGISSDKLAFYSAVMGAVNPILETTYGINSSNVQTLIRRHKHDIISKLIIDGNNWMGSNAPLLNTATPPAPIPAKVALGSSNLIEWLQTNTNFLTVSPFSSGPSEPFRNYSFKGVQPTSRLSYVDYHSYE